MRTEQKHKKIRVDVITAAQKPAEDPEALWRNRDIEAEDLVRLDPLDITPEVVAQAERPELADYNLCSLSPRKTTSRFEAMAHKQMKAELRAIHGEPETTAEFVARLRGSK